MICVGRHAVRLPPLHGKAARRLRLDRATVPSRTVTHRADCNVLETTADCVPGPSAAHADADVRIRGRHFTLHSASAATACAADAFTAGDDGYV